MPQDRLKRTRDSYVNQRDIVAELREAYKQNIHSDSLLLLAADQIEQLRAEVRILSESVSRLKKS